MRPFVVNPQAFQDPHLARYVSPDFESLSPDAQREELKRAQLRACHLPQDYADLTRDGQRSARFATFRSWYDREKPNVVCTNVDNLIASLYLWNTFYIKPAACNRGRYYYRDPLHKYEMVEAIFSPPKVATEPAKTLLIAPRGSTKTETIIQQAVPMMVCCRPNTEILVGEVNDTRTAEEGGKLLNQIEENDLIHEDFGGKGELFPRTMRGRKKWNAHEMDFVHLPGCRIMCWSVGSAQRGRHPCMLIWDDPEDPKKAVNSELRRQFFGRLFHVGMPMLTAGNICAWITTMILGSCAELAAKGRNLGDIDPELAEAMKDVRFEDWNRIVIDLLIEKEDGSMESVYPDHLSAEGYNEKVKALGKRGAMAEYRGIAIACGEFVFEIDPFKNGYMHCRRQQPDDEVPDEYFVDLATGEIIPWLEWLKTLFVGGANDLADSTAIDADYGSIVALGVNPRGKAFLLDAVVKRMIADDIVWRSFLMAGEWNAKVWGWETGALQRVVFRMAKRYKAQLEAQGMLAPSLIPLSNAQSEKVQRIIAGIRPPLIAGDLAFPVLEPVRDSKGRLHIPVRHTNTAYLRILYDQLSTYTDEGASGHDDGPDTIQMALRVLQSRRGIEIAKVCENDEQDQAWMDVGVNINRHLLPRECWSQRMREDQERSERMAMVGDLDEYDPYD